MVNVEVLFSKKITFSLKKKALNQTKLLQLMRNYMELMQMVLETYQIYLGQCPSMKNMGILKQSLMVESLLEITTERGSQKFYKPIYVHSLANALNEIKVSMIFLVVTFFVGRWVQQIVNKLNGREDCCAMKNLRYLLCCK